MLSSLLHARAVVPLAAAGAIALGAIIARQGTDPELEPGTLTVPAEYLSVELEVPIEPGALPTIQPRWTASQEQRQPRPEASPTRRSTREPLVRIDAEVSTAPDRGTRGDVDADTNPRRLRR